MSDEKYRTENLVLKGIENLEDLNLLDNELRKVAKPSLTPEEASEQRISLAMGMLPFSSTTTREYVEEMVKKNSW